jgi:hypothetical protein
MYPIVYIPLTFSRIKSSMGVCDGDAMAVVVYSWRRLVAAKREAMQRNIWVRRITDEDEQITL